MNTGFGWKKKAVLAAVTLGSFAAVLPFSWTTKWKFVTVMTIVVFTIAALLFTPFWKNLRFWGLLTALLALHVAVVWFVFGFLLRTMTGSPGLWLVGPSMAETMFLVTLIGKKLEPRRESGPDNRLAL
jgi:hypothetical protein